MDGLAFTAELIKALAWPASVVIVVFALRGTLASLAARVSKLRYKGFEADLRTTLRRARAGARRADLPSEREAAEAVVGGPERAEAKYRRLAAMSPRAAIVEAWRDPEQAVARVSAPEDFYDIEEYGKASARLTIERLAREGKLDRASAQLFEGLRHVRNSAVHANDTWVGRAEALKFAVLAAMLATKLGALRAQQSPGPDGEA